MANKFQDLWSRMIRLSADHLPWQACVDFQAREWPSMNLCERPSEAGMADIVKLFDQCYSTMSVRLDGYQVQLKYFPKGNFWSAKGQVAKGLDWKTEIDFTEGRSARGGIERLDEFALRAFDWLKGKTDGHKITITESVSRVSDNGIAGQTTEANQVAVGSVDG